MSGPEWDRAVRLAGGDRRLAAQRIVSRHHGEYRDHDGQHMDRATAQRLIRAARHSKPPMPFHLGFDDDGSMVVAVGFPAERLNAGAAR